MSDFEYAPAPESRAVVDIKPMYGLFIDGAFVDPQSEQYAETINPATEEHLADYAVAGDADVEAAVRAARRAAVAACGGGGHRAGLAVCAGLDKLKFHCIASCSWFSWVSVTV